jgi:hypothetical protein
MGAGGPVWHASVAGPGLSPTILQRLALDVLTGVGDASLGEWHEWTGRAYHVRRRLSAAEQERVGPAIDCRGTPEAARRFYAMQRQLPPHAISLAAEELSEPPCRKEDTP